MDISEIIKNAFIFPSKNLETLSIYAILTIFSGAFMFEGIINVIFGIVDLWNIVIGAIYIIISLIIGLIVRRISMDCIKSGIDLEEKLPDFKWWGSVGIGFKKVLLTIFYFIVPALIIVVIALVTNVIGFIFDIGQALIAQVPNVFSGNLSAADAIFNSVFPLFVSLTITIAAGLVIFLVFAFFQAMAEAKLAHTGSLKKALNIYQSAKDIKRIGVGKLVLLSFLIFVIIVAIEAVFMVIFDHIAFLSILNIIITPYLALFTQRSLGLLYSDIV